MRKLMILLALLASVMMNVSALEISAPTVPSYAEDLMADEPENLIEGIRQVLKEALGNLQPHLREAVRTCLGITGAVMLVSIIRQVPAGTENSADLVGTVSVSVIFLLSAEVLIGLGTETVKQISEYGKLLLPVMTAALAAQGGITGSTALYSVTAIFNAVLSGAIERVLIPFLYLFLVFSVSFSAVGIELLKRFRDCIKGLMTWFLKTVLYLFTGFISITGVISGPTDAAALKAAKLTISSFVPVVGGILSDASEAVLVSAGVVKNSAGMYGLFAVLAIWIMPFLRIGVHYILLRFTGIICSIYCSRAISDLIQDFATVMGFLVAMTGSVCLMQMISTVCFMRGVS